MGREIIPERRRGGTAERDRMKAGREGGGGGGGGGGGCCQDLRGFNLLPSLQ